MIGKYKEKLKKYRSCGLEKGGEFSNENLVFKVLRRNGYVEKLFDFDNKNMDDKLTLKEAVLNRPIDSWNITSPYGPRWGKQHHGIDLGTPSGTEIKSPSDGVVLDAAFKDGACGGTIYIDHENGYKTRYCHAKEINVSKGDRVKSGEVIGLTGGGKDDKGRGNSQGAHLHFELYKDGKIVDPQSIEYSKELVYSTDEVKDEEKLKTIDIVKTLIDKRQEFKDKTIDDVLNTYESSKFLANFIEIPQKNKTYENMRKYGKISFDEDVKKIQEALQYLGFSLPKWGVDGLYGPETEKAVRDFEKEFDLDINGKLTSNDVKFISAALLLKGFKDSDLNELQIQSDFSKINVGSDKEFYEEILKGVGAPITEENLKFFYSWRQAEGGKATNNPFNTTMKLKSDPNMTNYNKVGVKNYSEPRYGVEATIKTLKNGYYSCLIDGLKNDVGAENLAECLSTTKWGTGDLALKVVKSNKINPPQIYT
jgi:murein DD-endopeptidase MepM/ murein hydrolase activator NlpD